MRSPELIQPPAALPITLDEAKRHCRIDHSDDDELISEYISAATRKLDGYSGALGRALITQSWRMHVVPDRLGRIRFPFDPIREVTTITAAGETIASSRYAVDREIAGPWLVALDRCCWPTSGPLVVEFVAGYGADPADIPADIRTAIRLDVELQYDRPDGPRFEALREQYRDIVRRNRRGNL